MRIAQWNDSEVSRHSIADYLAKVTSLRWVLEECCRRVPDEPEAVQLLLEFGEKAALEGLGSLGALTPRGAAPAAAASAAAAPTDPSDPPEGRAASGLQPAAAGETPLTERELRGYVRRLRRYGARLASSLQVCRDRGSLMISASFTFDGGHFLLQLAEAEEASGGEPLAFDASAYAETAVDF